MYNLFPFRITVHCAHYVKPIRPPLRGKYIWFTTCLAGSELENQPRFPSFISRQSKDIPSSSLESIAEKIEKICHAIFSVLRETERERERRREREREAHALFPERLLSQAKHILYMTFLLSYKPLDVIFGVCTLPRLASRSGFCFISPLIRIW